jgi:hypothetical protein
MLLDVIQDCSFIQEVQRDRYLYGFRIGAQVLCEATKNGILRALVRE